MATVHKETDVIERILTECDDDYVGLWVIYRQIREARFRNPKEATLDLLGFFLWSERLEAGVPDAQGGWIPWKDNPGQAIDRIKSAWNALGRDPGMGDIVWFTSPTPSV